MTSTLGDVDKLHEAALRAAQRGRIARLAAALHHRVRLRDEPAGPARRLTVAPGAHWALRPSSPGATRAPLLRPVPAARHRARPHQADRPERAAATTRPGSYDHDGNAEARGAGFRLPFWADVRRSSGRHAASASSSSARSARGSRPRPGRDRAPQRRPRWVPAGACRRRHEQRGCRRLHAGSAASTPASCSYRAPGLTYRALVRDRRRGRGARPLRSPENARPDRRAGQRRRPAPCARASRSAR